MLSENMLIGLHQTMQMGFVFVLKLFQDKYVIAIVIVITFNVIAIDNIVILFIRNQACDQ